MTAPILRSDADYIQLAKDHDRLQQAYASAMRLMRSITGNPPTNDRATGRTTRLILRAMIAVSEGHDVWIVAQSFKQAHELRNKVLERCHSWHIPVTSKRIRSGVPNDNCDGFQGVVLVDHFAIESMEQQAALNG